MKGFKENLNILTIDSYRDKKHSLLQSSISFMPKINGFKVCLFVLVNI